MTRPKRIFIVADMSGKSIKIFLNQMPKLAKGLIRLGHDARIFSYCDALRQLSPFKSKTITSRFYKSKVDHLLANRIKDYKPDIVYVSFARILNTETIEIVREVAGNAVFIGGDGDPWPKLQGDRIETAKKLDILTATNDGQFLQDYRDAGVPLCVFMPNMCDPDIDRHYPVGAEWQTAILWTGKAKHHADSSETLRQEIVARLIQREDCTIYGSCGRPQIGGFDYLYAISGARIGVNVNAVNSIRLYHSDRLTHYLSCGTFVLAKRVPDTDLLFKDGLHLKYFDTVDEFFDLADWYLNHEDERKKIADAGMKHVHENFNSQKIAGYFLDLAEKGTYKAPWNTIK
ncbi:MAG: glycosyltransferase family 1 protein [Planctomycetes bacterium]|nr:glycosyltransferase family 1 protein [Planctomycetota bacterium]